MKKTVLITGGAKRFGRYLVEHFLSNGWQVAVHFNRGSDEVDELILEYGVENVKSYQQDFSEENPDFCRLIDSVVNDFGDLNCIINNASIFEFDHASSFSADILDQSMVVNFLAPLKLSMAYFYYLQGAERRGAVVNILDQKLSNLNADYFSYTLSKLALKESTRFLAMSLAPVLRVNAISPGLMLLSGNQSQGNFSMVHSMTALGVGTKMKSVAEAVYFMAMADQVTGQVLCVDDGQHLIPQVRDVMFLEAR